MPGRVSECLRARGYVRATGVQRRVFNIVAGNGRSVVVVAPTGTGKTEAAVFPVMYRIAADRLPPISAIYISPLRALNRDLYRRLKRIGECFHVRVGLRHGDTSSSQRRRLRESPPHLLITTPETFGFLLIGFKTNKFVENIRYIIIDEFRELVESKRGALLFTLIHLLEEKLGRKILKIALTATLSNTEKAKKLLNDDETIIVRDTESKKKKIKITIPECRTRTCRKTMEIIGDPELAARITTIIQTIAENKGTLIFTNTRAAAEKLGVLINKTAQHLGINIKVTVHHGSLSRTHRLQAEEGFRQGGIQGLIATSSMELGVDIGNISHVIQYMSPRQAVRLSQRIGRSGHALHGVSKGTIIATRNPYQLAEAITLAERTLGEDLEEETIIPKPLDVLAYAIAIKTLMDGVVDEEELYGTIRKHPLYHDLTLDEYNRLIEYLEYTHIVRRGNEELRPTRKTRLYIYLHSMIPDTRDMLVVEASTRRRIGALNEEYVILNVNQGDTLVLGGDSWRVISIDEDEGKIYVEPLGETDTLLIPHWEGENIPVEARTSRMVAETLNNPSKERPGDLEIDGEAARILEDFREKYSPPGKEEIRVIFNPRYRLIFILSYWGSRLNSLLRDLAKYLLATRYPGLKIYAYKTPYAIIIAEEKGLLDRQMAEYIAGTLRNLPEYTSMGKLRLVAKASRTLHWRIYQVAQRFGAINVRSKSELRITRKMLESLEETIIGEEAFKEVLYKDYDLESLGRLVEGIRRGETRITVTVNSDRKLAMAITGYTDKPIPSGSKPIDEEKYLGKIMSRKATLVCLSCGHRITGTVRELMDMKEYRCPKCHRVALAPVKGSGEREAEIVAKNIKGEKLSSEEKKILKDLRKRALLLLHYGSTAILLLASPGVGVREAVRIINNMGRGASLAEEIYRSEKKYLKIKKYLD